MKPAEVQDLVTLIAGTPEAVRRLTAELSADELRRKPSAAEFSALEHACHLRDIEREGYAVRLGRLLAEHEPVLPDLDGGRLARERDYQSQDFGAALDAFTQARRENVAVIESLSPDQLLRAGTFEGVGRITVARLLEMMRDHDELHRAELQSLVGGLRP